MTPVAICSDRDVHVAAATDLYVLYAGRQGGSYHLNVTITGVDPGWFGYGWDQDVTVAIAPCLRLGGREQVVWHNLTLDPPDPDASGSEWQLITQLMLGTELALPLRFEVGAYLLPGVRSVLSTQYEQVPERDVHLAYHHISFVPVLYSEVTLRWWATHGLGVHVAAQLPIAGFARELGWFPNRLFGAGVDVRW